MSGVVLGCVDRTSPAFVIVLGPHREIRFRDVDTSVTLDDVTSGRIIIS